MGMDILYLGHMDSGRVRLVVAELTTIFES